MNRLQEGTSPLLINESPMQFLPSLACLVGVDGAMFLQQLHYWLQHSNNLINGHFWVYNTMDSWRLQFCWWSESKINRTIGKLRHFEYKDTTYQLLVTEHLSPDKMYQRLYYRINYDELNKLAPLAQECRAEKMWKIVNASKQLSRQKEQLKLNYRALLYVDEKGSIVMDAGSPVQKKAPAAPICQNDKMGEMPMNTSSVPICQNDKMGDASSHSIKMTECSLSERQDTICQNDTMQSVKTQESTISTTEYKQQISASENTQQSGAEAAKMVEAQPGQAGSQSQGKRVCVVTDLDLKRFRDTLRKYGVDKGLNAEHVMRSILETYPRYVILDAIVEACSRGGCSLNYVKTILEHKRPMPQKSAGLTNEGGKPYANVPKCDSYAAEEKWRDDFWAQYGF